MIVYGSLFFTHCIPKKNCDKKIHSRRLGACDFWDFMAAMWRQGDSLEFLFEEHILMLL